VRILLDEQLPRRLARALTGHEVRTVHQQGWAGVKNGELLRLAAREGFEACVTADQNLEFQQNLSGSPLRVLVLFARSNAIEDVEPLVPELLLALPRCRPGEILRVGR
jgi:predicted nuclease of predicted toxin-antitoxin system